MKTVCILLVFCAAMAIGAPAQVLTTLYNFDATDGYPFAGLVQATDGNFYGTTFSSEANCAYGTCGFVFKIIPSGTLTALRGFYGANGAEPNAGLVQATDGNFYGTTVYGGANNSSNCDGPGCGTVFKITPSGTLTTLYSFCSQSNCADGYGPWAPVVQATDGNFYGTTFYGGANNGGTVFKITPSGTLTTLYSFCSESNCADGQYPNAGLVQATDGNFYGTTTSGGANGPYRGTVFKITPSGTLTTLYSFCSQNRCTDGEEPYAGLVQATDGNFYGTTYVGGANTDGVVFKITPSGNLTTIYTFCSQSNCADGGNPLAGLVQATDGNFYGTTIGGGADSSGTIFKIAPSGTLTTLYNFCSENNCADGQYAAAGLVQATDGNFYGTNYDGGANNAGTVFRLNVELGPSVILSPLSLNFGPQGLHNLNAPQNIALTNTGTAPLLISSIVITGTNKRDFEQGNNCPMSPNTLAPGDYCTITVVFAPTDTGMLQADITLTDNAANSPQMVSLTGIGVGGKVRLK